jgi:hypothetical protein
MITQLAFTFRRPIVKRQVTTWRVVAVLADGHGNGNCGHSHAEQIDAERCPWTPTPWPEVCDLLVRQVRDVVASGDRVRTKPRRAA